MRQTMPGSPFGEAAPHLLRLALDSAAEGLGEGAAAGLCPGARLREERATKLAQSSPARRRLLEHDLAGAAVQGLGRSASAAESAP